MLAPEGRGQPALGQEALGEGSLILVAAATGDLAYGQLGVGKQGACQRHAPCPYVVGDAHPQLLAKGVLELTLTEAGDGGELLIAKGLGEVGLDMALHLEDTGGKARRNR